VSSSIRVTAPSVVNYIVLKCRKVGSSDQETLRSHSGRSSLLLCYSISISFD